VITPSILESWFGTSSELRGAGAIQTLVVAIAMIVLVASSAASRSPVD